MGVFKELRKTMYIELFDCQQSLKIPKTITGVRKAQSVRNVIWI